MSLIPKGDTTEERDRSRENDRDVDLRVYSKILVPFNAILLDWILSFFLPFFSFFFFLILRKVSILYRSLEISIFGLISSFFQDFRLDF